MNPEIYGEWLRRQGQRVVRTDSSYWHTEGLGVYQAFPYHWMIDPSEAELSELFTGHGVVALRYSMSPHSGKGCPSYAIVFEGENYDFENLGHRTRKNVRRGLRCCAVERIPFQQLVEQAWDLRRDALERQGRQLNITYDSWRSRYLNAVDLPGFEAWGAWVSGTLAGYVVSFQMAECFCIIDHQSHRGFLDQNVNNAMTFTVSQHALTRPGVQLLFYGLESLDAPPRVSEFKFHMGYAAKPIRQRVLLRPRLAPLANNLTYRLVGGISRLIPSNRRFSKAEGMLRLFLERTSADNARDAHPDAAESCGDS
jgi:hypothetical protein